MKPTKEQQILEAIAMLDQFAAQTPLPRGWHANWQTGYQQTVAKVQTIMADKPADADEAAPA